MKTLSSPKERQSTLKHGTGFIQFEDRSALNRLRLNEYRHSDASRIKDSALLWSECDNNAHVLGVWKRGELIASMRLEIVKSKELLEHKIVTQVPQELELKYPVGVLSKAVTASDYRGSGLNAHLRYHLFNVAMSEGIKHIFGTLIKDASHAKSLKDMGYNFYDHLKLSDKADLVFLDLSQNGKLAVATCAKLASNSLLFYPWISPSLKMEKGYTTF